MLQCILLVMASKARDTVEGLAKGIQGLIESAKSLKDKFPFLKKNSRKLSEKVVEKLQSLYDVGSDGVNDFFPYPEVEHFLKHFKYYSKIALLQPERISEANQTVIFEEFEKALKQIVVKTYAINFSKGHAHVKVKLFF